jgi:hypothetical protein
MRVPRLDGVNGAKQYKTFWPGLPVKTCLFELYQAGNSNGRRHWQLLAVLVG